MAKVLPEWIAGGPGADLQTSYNKSTDGSILLDDNRGSVDLRGAPGTWDAPHLTLGYTGENPTTVLSPVTAKISSEQGSITDSLNSAIIGGYKGTIEGYSNNSVIEGSVDVKMENVSHNSQIVSSNHVKTNRTDKVSIIASAGGDASAEWWTPGYSGFSSVEGIESIFHDSGATGPVASQMVLIGGSSLFRAVGMERGSILSSSGVAVSPSTITHDEDTFLVPVQHASVTSSAKVTIAGRVEQLSISSSANTFVQSDQFAARQISIAGTSEVTMVDAQLTSVQGSYNVEVVGATGAGVYLDPSHIHVGGANDVLLEGAQRTSVESSSYVQIGNFGATGTSSVQNVSVSSSNYVKMDMASNSAVVSSAYVSLQNDDNMDTIKAFVAASTRSGMAGGQYSAIIATGEPTSPPGDYLDIDKNNPLYTSMYRTNFCLIAASTSDTGGDFDRSPRIGFSKTSSILSVRSGTGDSNIPPGIFVKPPGGFDEGSGITGSEAAMLSSSTDAILYGSSEVSVDSSSATRVGYTHNSRVSSSNQTAVGYMPPGFTGEHAARVSGIPYADYHLGGPAQNYGNSRCSVDANYNSVFFGNTNSVMQGGHQNVMAPFNDNSTMHGGVENSFVNSDRSSLLGGIKIQLGPWSHDTVAGGGYLTSNREVVKSASFANSNSSFQKTSSGTLIAATDSSTFRTVNPAIVSSERVSITESTEGLGQSSEDVTITGSFRSGAILSKNSSFIDTNSAASIASNNVNMEKTDLAASVASASITSLAGTDYLHAAASSLATVEKSDHVSIDSSHNIDITNGVRVAVKSSDNVEVEDTTGLFVGAAINLSVSEAFDSSALASYGTLNKVNRVALIASSSGNIRNSRDSLLSASGGSIRSSAQSTLMNCMGYTSLDNSSNTLVSSVDYCGSTANAHGSFLSGLLYSNIFSLRNTSVQGGISVTTHKLDKSLVAGVSSSTLKDLVSTSVIASEAINATSTNSTLVGGVAGGGTFEKVDQFAAIGSGLSKAFNVQQGIMQGSSNCELYSSSRVGTGYSYTSTIHTSNMCEIRTSQATQITGNSAWSSIENTNDSILIGSYRTTIASSSFVDANANTNVFISSSTSETVVRNNRETMVSAGSGNLVTGVENTVVEASYACQVENINNGLLSSSSLSHLKEESHLSSIISSYGGIVTGRTTNAVIIGSSKGNISGQSHHSFMQGASESSIGGNTIRGLVSASEKVTLNDYSHRTSVQSSRDVIIGSHSEGSTVQASDNVVLVNASRNSGVLASTNVVMTGSETSTSIASRNVMTVDADHAAAIASDGAEVKHDGETVRANGYYDSIGEAQTSNFLLRSVTNDNTTIQDLFLNGATGVEGDRFNLKTNSTYSAKVMVSGKGATGGVGAVQNFEGLLSCGDEYIDTVSVSSSFTGCSSDAIMQDIDVTVGATGLLFNVSVQGADASLETRWVADVTLTKVSY